MKKQHRQRQRNQAWTNTTPAFCPRRRSSMSRHCSEPAVSSRLSATASTSAPVLTRADVGIAMGALGSDAAIESADVVLMDDKPSKLPAAIRLSRRTMRIVKQNIAFALLVKGALLLLGAVGIANMWTAVFGDVGVTVLAILNAMRAMKKLPPMNDKIRQNT